MLLPLLAALAAVPLQAQMTRIGNAGAVAGKVQAAAPGQAGRIVESGKPLFLNEQVTTGPGGRLQILLLDETVFTIGPNSDLTLDEFVYDPATSAGKVTAKVTKGVFRVVTGKLARRAPDSIKVKMPVGTMGIRGTITGGQVGENGSTVVLFGPGSGNNAGENPGSVGVGNAGSEVVLDKPGFGTTVAEGQPPAPPSDMSGQLGQLFGSLDSEGSDSGSSGSSGGDGDEGGGSASEQSGQDTAAGGASSSDFGDDAALAEELENDAARAAQEAAEAIPDGVATWEQVRIIETGTGQYNGSGTGNCSGSGCGASTFAMDFKLNIDFAARTAGGGSSQINLVDIVSAGQTRGTSISTIDFSSLSGDAVITLDSGSNNSPYQTGDDFTGTTLSLANDEGVIAAEAKVDLQMTGTASGGFSATGQMEGDLGEQPPE